MTTPLVWIIVRTIGDTTHVYQAYNNPKAAEEALEWLIEDEKSSNVSYDLKFAPLMTNFYE